MTYDTETRQELQNTEVREDVQAEIREKANEFDDGALDSYIEDNNSELVEAFADSTCEFKSFCHEEHSNTAKDWIAEHKGRLENEFSESREEEFKDFCKEQFNEANE